MIKVDIAKRDFSPEKGKGQFGSIKVIGFILLMTGILAACGSAPVARPPQAFEQALAADKDARRALRSGDLSRAKNDFAKALALQQSLDDAAGSATSLINLATVNHQLYDDKAALAWLDKILMEKVVMYPPELYLTASFRKAVILTNMTRVSEADAALQLSEKQCENKCMLRFGINTLRARLTLLKGDAEGALLLAQALSKEVDAGKEEQANALRVVAAAEEKLARNESALQHYQSALEMDKSSGLSMRIGEDLTGMARVSTLLGRNLEAAVYARRAALVNESHHQQVTATGE